MTQLFIAICFLLAVVKKTIPVIALCSLLFLIDFGAYVLLFSLKLYVFIYNYIGEDSEREDSSLLDGFLLLMIAVIAIMHLMTTLTTGLLCIQYFLLQVQNQKSNRTPSKDEIV